MSVSSGVTGISVNRSWGEKANLILTCRYGLISWMFLMGFATFCDVEIVFFTEFLVRTNAKMLMLPHTTVFLPFRELKRERERAELWRGLEEHQERRMQMLTDAARNQRNLQEQGERGDLPAPSSAQAAHSDQLELKSGGTPSYSSGATESAT